MSTTLSDKLQERVNNIEVSVLELAQSTTSKAQSAKKAEIKDNVCNWISRLTYCVQRMDAEEFAPDFLHNIEEFIKNGTSYLAITDKVITNTLVQLVRELSPILGLKEHRLFTLTDGELRETVLPGGIWLVRRTGCNVRKNKNSFTFRINNAKSMTEWDMKSRMYDCVELVKE